MSKRWWFVIVAAVLLIVIGAIALVVVKTGSSSDDSKSNVEPKKAESVEDVERADIVKFFREYDHLERQKVDAQLKYQGDYVGDLLNAIPPEIRGPTAQVLQQYKNKVQHALSPDVRSVKEKEQVLDEFSQTGNDVMKSAQQSPAEFAKIQLLLFDQLSLLGKITTEDSNFVTNVNKAIQELRSKLTPVGLVRQEKLLTLLTALEQEKDFIKMKEHVQRLRDIQVKDFGYRTSNA